MKADVDDLLNAEEVATALGLSHRQAVATYRRRYDDFPQPVIVKGTCVLWLRQDVERWAKATGRLSSRRSVPSGPAGVTHRLD